MRFSTPKRFAASPNSAPPSVIRPGRDAFLAGLAVAGAISLGAYVVYDRAWTEKVADVRHHVAELAHRLRKSASEPHQAAQNLTPAERAEAADLLSAPLVRARNDEVRRIYTFALQDDEKFTLLDTGNRNEKPASRPLPPDARKAIEHFRNRIPDPNDQPWTIIDGLEATAFSLIPAGENQAPGVIGIEADSDQLEVKISTVRQALWFTCLLGLAMGAAAGMLVGRMRARAAQIQAQLEENHRFEEAIIESLGEAVYAYDARDGIFRWRGNVAPLLGFTPDAGGETKSAWLARLHEDDLPRYLAAIEDAEKKFRPMQVEYRVRNGGKSVVWVLDRSHPLRTRDGRVHLVGSLIDLTERREAEENLRLFFDETATAHLVFDGDSIMDANPAAVALFGAPGKSALVSLPVWKLWPRRQGTNALSVEGWSVHVLNAMESGASHFEWQLSRLDGTLVDCDVFLRPATLRNRSVLLMACYDISPAKRAQAQLIESEQRFRDVSNAAGEFIWETDHESVYIYASRRVADILGLEPEVVLGRMPHDFACPEDREMVRSRLAEIRRSGMPFKNFEHRVVRADGAVLWISTSGVPVYNPSGEVIGYRGTSLDITKHRESERELLRQKETAETADRAKSNFLAMMSHEIRTPLNSVLGFADLVLNTDLDPVQRDYLQTIKSSGDSLLVLLNDILDFSKIESGSLEIEIRPVDLVRCIEEVLALCRPAAKGKSLALSAHFAGGMPRHLLTDESRLRQILLNLVGNAVKFTSSGSIHVEVLPEPQTPEQDTPVFRIEVSDTGIGIPAEQRSRLFKPFSQADSSTTRRFGGSGLGLAISRRLALLMGGNLDLADREGPGSTFCVSLPLVLPSTDLGNLPAKSEAKPFLQGMPETFPGPAPRVLVVDDNALNLRLMIHLLRQIGAKASMASSAAECFEKLEAEAYDLILMDVQMPVMDGLAATRHIRAHEHGRETPIVALTADAMAGDRERCLEAGMNDYLTKPLRRSELLRVLHRFAPAEER